MDTTGERIHGNAARLFGEMLGFPTAAIEQEGDLLGPYRLRRRLGEGGFGNVWSADSDPPGSSPVAVKVIKMGMGTMRVLERFNQERQALSSLSHPGIAGMLNPGVTRDGRPYFAMELVDGLPISQWATESGATITERLLVLSQVCEAVQHAHQRGIIHRDLKPGNILVTLTDCDPTPKIIDFGIAKAIHADTFDDYAFLTQDGQLLGTPHYMSPEQIAGRAGIDTRSDVYSLGSILYELLTGVVPFADAVDADELKKRIQRISPVRPSVRINRIRRSRAKERPLPATASAQVETIPGDLDWITMRALAKDRNQRYQSASELAADIQRFLQGDPVLARPAGALQTIQHALLGHPVAVSASGLLTLGVITGVALYLHTLRQDLAMLSDPTTPVIVAAVLTPAAKLAQQEKITNSLGMTFIAVADTNVRFCIHETRRSDYAAYATENPSINGAWQAQRNDRFPVGHNEDHPVCAVSWDDAASFCDWLSKKEHRAYRLPTDREWSIAAGLGEAEPSGQGITPELITTTIMGRFQSPLQPGNYADETWHKAFPTLPAWIEGYDDHFPTTSPVGSFPPNAQGLHDIGGNLWEWVGDWYNPSRFDRIARGLSWAQRGFHLSTRIALGLEYRGSTIGFRIVLEPSDESLSLETAIDGPSPSAPTAPKDP